MFSERCKFSITSPFLDRGHRKSVESRDEVREAPALLDGECLSGIEEIQDMDLPKVQRDVRSAAQEVSQRGAVFSEAIPCRRVFVLFLERAFCKLQKGTIPGIGGRRSRTLSFLFLFFDF